MRVLITALIVALIASCTEQPRENARAEKTREDVRIVPQLNPVQPRRVVFAPDKEDRLLILEAAGLVGLWDVRDVTHPVRTAWIPAGAVDATFSSDATEIVTAGWDGKVRWWDTGGKLLRTSAGGHQGWARSLAVGEWRSPGSTVRIDDVVSGGEDGTLRIWGRDGMARGEPIAAHDGFVVSIAMRANGDLVSAGTDEVIRLWEKDPSSPSGYRARVLLEQEKSKLKPQLTHLMKTDLSMGWDHSVAFSPGASALAAANFDGGVRLWGTGDWSAPQIVYPPDYYNVRAVAWAPSGDMFAIGRFDGKVALRNADGSGRGELTNPAPVMSVGFSTTGARLATASSLDDRVRLWKLDGTLLAELPSGASFAVMAVALSDQGLRFATADASGQVRRWRIDGSPPVESLMKTDGGVFALAFSPDGESLVAGGGDGAVQLYGSNGSKAVKHSIGTYIDEASYSPRGDTFAIAGNRKVEVLNADGSARTGPFRTCEETIFGIAFSPVEDVAAILCEIGTATLWSLDGKPRGPLFEPEAGGARGLAMSPSAQLLASGGLDGAIHFWELPPRPLDDRVHVGLPIDQVGLHQKGSWASANRDTALFFDTGGHIVATAVISPDGLVVFTPDGWFAGSRGAERLVRAFRADGTALSAAETAERLAPAKVSAALRTS